MKIIASFNKNTDKIQTKLKEKFPEIEFSFYKNMDEAAEHIDSAEVLLTYGEDVTEELIEKAANLKWIMVVSAGLEKMPLQKINEKNIFVTNARGIHKIPMAEFAFAYMLQYAKRMPDFIKQKEEGVWKRLVPLKELYGHTLLVVGAGAIGSQIGSYAKVFGMKTIGINSSGRPVEEFDETYPLEQLNKVLPKADYVLSLLPKTSYTNDVFAKEQFSLMKNTAVFINMGRGNSVVEEDLLEALNNDEIAHAFLDVFKTEPLPNDHPFWTCEKLTITPHLTAVTEQYLPRAMEIFEENLHTYLIGGKDFLNYIDLNRGY